MPFAGRHAQSERPEDTFGALLGAVSLASVERGCKEANSKRLLRNDCRFERGTRAHVCKSVVNVAQGVFL